MACSRVCTTSSSLFSSSAGMQYLGGLESSRGCDKVSPQGSRPLCSPKERGPQQPGNWPRLQEGRWARAQVAPGLSGQLCHLRPMAKLQPLQATSTPTCMWIRPTPEPSSPQTKIRRLKALINQIQTCPQTQQPLVSLPSGDLLLGWHLTGLSSRWRTGRDQGSACVGRREQPHRWGLDGTAPLTGAKEPGRRWEETRPELTRRARTLSASQGRAQGMATRVPGGPAGTHPSPMLSGRWWQRSAHRQAPPDPPLWDSKPCCPWARVDT